MLFTNQRKRVLNGTRGLGKPASMALSTNRRRKLVSAGPISWAGYTVILIPMPFERHLNTFMRIGWSMLCIPSFVLYWIALGSPTQFTLLGSPYFYGLILIGAPVIYELYQSQEKGMVPSEAKATVSNHPALLSETPTEVSWK